MPLAYAPEEVKERLATALDHGDIAEIVRRTRLHSTTVKEMFNAECDRNNQFANVLEIFVTEYEIDEERGEEMMRRFVDMYETSKRRKVGELSSDAEAANLIKNAGDFVAAKVAKADPLDQLAQIQKVERSADTTRRAIIHDITREPLRMLSPPHQPTTRELGREAVSRYRRTA